MLVITTFYWNFRNHFLSREATQRIASGCKQIHSFTRLELKGCLNVEFYWKQGLLQKENIFLQKLGRANRY